jgi:hypothetical protein
MELENFSHYHIGIKLNSRVNLQELRSMVEDFCRANSYSLNKKENALVGDFFSVEINTGVNPIAEKEGVNIQMNLPLRALNFIGKNPSKVTEEFSKVIEFIQQSGKYEMNVFYDFFEVITEASLSNSKTPLEILNDNTNPNFETLRSKIGEDASVCGIRIKSKGALTDGRGGMEIILEPHPNRPSKEFFARVVWQTKDMDKLLNFKDDVKEILVSLLE